MIGRAALGGTLNVAFIDEFMAELGNSFRLLDAAGGLNNSRFATINLPDIAPLRLDPRYDATGLSLMTV